MNQTLLRAAAIFVPIAALFGYAMVALARRRTIGSVMQFVGAVCLVVVVLTHVAEALALFPAMQWGRPASVGHYLDLSSAVLGLTLVPLGFFLHRRGVTPCDSRGSRR